MYYSIDTFGVKYGNIIAKVESKIFNKKEEINEKIKCNRLDRYDPGNRRRLELGIGRFEFQLGEFLVRISFLVGNSRLRLSWLVRFVANCCFGKRREG